ncbi:MAG: LamG-like jellyroll fold domain-containing protein [Gemmataceae bacterium]
MAMTRRLTSTIILGCLFPFFGTAWGQTLRVSFDEGTQADRADGRAEPWLSRDVEQVPGKVGMAARLGERGQLIYGGEQNILAGQGTLAFWCRIPERPGPTDIQRLIFVQCKERGYWNYLATMEWQEGVFRAKVFDFCHGHGWHDPDALPAFQAATWHHVALVWDQAEGVKFFLDGKLTGSTWRQQAWWDRPTPHAIHLCYPGASYDELCIYDRCLSDEEIGALVMDNRWQVPRTTITWSQDAYDRLASSLGTVGVEHLPTIDVADQQPDTETVIRQARVTRILDDRIPAWKVMDGRMNLFWPEWRAPTLGDVDFSGSEISVTLEPGQRLTHLVLRGLVGGCRVHGERDGFVSHAPLAEVPTGLHYLSAHRLPPDLTGLRVPRREGMKLHEIGLFAVERRPISKATGRITPITGFLDRDALGGLVEQIHTLTLPHERTLLGKGKGVKSVPVAGLSRVHFVSKPVTEALPLDAVSLRLTFSAPWRADVWWLRVQDPVNPRRDLMNVPVRVLNPVPGKQVTLAVTLDFWDVVLDPGTRLWVELLPTQSVTLATDKDNANQLSLKIGDRAKVLAEFAFTQGQLAFSYWQLGSEGSGRQGANPEARSFNLLGGITDNHELKLTLEWVRRHVADDRLVNNLWRITHEKRTPAPVTPRLQPEGAPAWAVWGRELLERYRAMSHLWADWQGPDGQLGGGWNDDPTFPGVYICLPLLGDTRTQTMFERIFDGVEETGYLRNGVCRGPIDTGHARDLVAWRGHLMLFDYGQPRHVERALAMTRELHRWTRLDENGHRRAVTNHYSEDGPQRRPRSKVNDDGLIEQINTEGDFSITPLLMDSIFCAWYSRNPTVLKFVAEVAEGELARQADPKRTGGYPFVSFAQLFNDPKYAKEPLEPYLPSAAEKAKVVQGIRAACETLEGGWQFRGGEARGANDHFSVPGQTELSRMYLGFGMTWLRTAITMVPPIAVSWEGLEDQVAALVLEASSTKLRVAVYNFDAQPRAVRMRVWRLADGKYQLRTGHDSDGDDQIDGPAATDEINLHRASPIALQLPSRRVFIVELDQLEARSRPEQLADLAVGTGDVFYDLATDRLKVVVHNIGAAPAKNITVRFETPDGKLLGRHVIEQLDAPLDLRPQTAVAWLSQPTLHPVDRIIVHVDPDDQIEEITKENNRMVWQR